VARGMSSKHRKKIYKTFRFRLTISFSLAFIFLSLILFAFAYFLLSSSLQDNDRTSVTLKLKEYSDEYRSGSIDGLKRKIKIDSGSGSLKYFMVRLADAQNKTILLQQPGEGVNYNFLQLARIAPKNDSWIQLKANGEDDVLDIASARLPDSNLIQVGKGPEQREELLNHFQANFLEELFVAVLLSIAAGAVLSRQALRPLQRFTKALGPIIDTGQVKARVPVLRSGDEFEELGIRFNQAFEKIDTLIQGIRASMDNVAHDLRTPMTRLRAVAENAMQWDPSPEAYREALSDCLEESEQVLRMLNMLMDISEVETGSVQLCIAAVNINDLSTQIIDLYRGVAEDRNISLTSNCPPLIIVQGDQQRLLQMLANLVDNAIKYTPVGGRVEINASANDNSMLLTVCDSGTGIPAEDINKIWDRSFRGDKSRTQRGLGLGLSLVKAVVTAHGGTTNVASILGQGTQFSIHLPFIPVDQSRYTNDLSRM
jgi:signal transduction histidine kinase